jgi:hypothetical protein
MAKPKKKPTIEILFRVDGRVLSSNGVSRLDISNADKYEYMIVFKKPFSKPDYKIQPPLIGLMRCATVFEEKRCGSVIVKLHPMAGCNLVSADTIPVTIYEK